MRVLGLIPARGGSKGIPHKNIRLLNGKPLLQYTAEAALQARSLSNVILTTDDEQIATVGRECGLMVPFMRPSHLAQDNTPTLPVIQHAINWCEIVGDYYDAICLLQPTSPFRQTKDIDACIQLLWDNDADAVVTVLPVPPKYNPHWVYFQTVDGSLHLSTGELIPLPRRQELPPAFHREGSIYVTRRDIIVEQNSLYGQKLLGYLIEPERSVNIDTVEDWHQAERIMQT